MLPPNVRRPDYDFENVGVGIVHLGMGAFHRAHQAMFTEDALSGGGDWGILGVSLRHPAASEALAALNPLPVLDYWRTVRVRFANPHIDYRLSQIAEDGALKLAERIFPLMIANAATGAPVRSLSRIVRNWLESSYRETPVESALDDPALFPLPIRENASLRAALLEVVA